jgi:ABC-type thiamine transport system ATPase subunit
VGSGAGGHTRTRRGAERVGEFLERFPSWPSGGRRDFLVVAFARVRTRPLRFLLCCAVCHLRCLLRLQVLRFALSKNEVFKICHGPVPFCSTVRGATL